jgi:predicted HNH restriction endonuclease
MNTPETKLTVEASAYQPDSLLSFHQANREVLRITHDGRMIKGEGLSWEEATQEAAKLLIASFKEQIQKMVDNRLAADTARMDWLEKEALEDWRIRSINRASIDKAMKEAIK